MVFGTEVQYGAENVTISHIIWGRNVSQYYLYTELQDLCHRI